MSDDAHALVARCVEHDLPKPCLRCALLCACGCDSLRAGVSEEVWDAAKVIEPFIRLQEARDARP